MSRCGEQRERFIWSESRRDILWSGVDILPFTVQAQCKLIGSVRVPIPRLYTVSVTWSLVMLRTLADTVLRFRELAAFASVTMFNPFSVSIWHGLTPCEWRYAPCDEMPKHSNAWSRTPLRYGDRISLARNPADTGTP